MININNSEKSRCLLSMTTKLNIHGYYKGFQSFTPTKNNTSLTTKTGLIYQKGPAFI
jgi:hypothetical protein